MALPGEYSPLAADTTPRNFLPSIYADRIPLPDLPPAGPHAGRRCRQEGEVPELWHARHDPGSGSCDSAESAAQAGHCTQSARYAVAASCCSAGDRNSPPFRITASRDCWSDRISLPELSADRANASQRCRQKGEMSELPVGRADSGRQSRSEARTACSIAPATCSAADSASSSCTQADAATARRHSHAHATPARSRSQRSRSHASRSRSTVWSCSCESLWRLDSAPCGSVVWRAGTHPTRAGKFHTRSRASGSRTRRADPWPRAAQ